MARTKRSSARAGEWKPRWLEVFRETGMVAETCRRTAVGVSTVYDARDADEEFKAAWDEIVEITTEEMEAEARRRAVDGVEEPVFYQGEEAGTIRRYSDGLLMFMLKGRRPEVYRDNVRHEHSGPGGGPIRFEDLAAAATGDDS